VVLVLLLRFARGVFQLEIIDTAVVNLGTYGLVLSALLALWLRFTLRSAYDPVVRRNVLIAGIVGMLFVATCVRINGFTGDMVPTGFRFAWQQPPDFAREKPVVNLPVVVNAPNEVTTNIADNPSADPNAPNDPNDPNASATFTSPASASLEPTPADFPQFLGPQRDGYVSGRDLADDWQTSPPHERWRKPVGPGWSAFSVVGERAVTMEQYGNEEWVTCRDLNSGELLWSHVEQTRHENVMGGVGPRATPTIHNAMVYTHGATGILLCLRLQDGCVVWRDDLQERYFPKQDDRPTNAAERQRAAEVAVMWGRAGSPLIYCDLCIVPAGGPLQKEKSLVAFDSKTGEFRWDSGTTQISYASPVVLNLLGQDQLVSVNESDVTGHDPQTGALKWRYPWLGQSNAAANCSQPHRLSNDTLFLSKGYGVGAAVVKLTPATAAGALPFVAETVWSNHRVLKTKFTNVVVLDGFAYGLNDGVLECVDTATGESRWKKGRFGNGQVLGVDRTLLVLAERTGEVAMIAADPQRYRELTRFAALGTSSQAWNNLCLSGRLLLVRNADEAACFELP
jgi:outer membrane protein assembly factor BamB